MTRRGGSSPDAEVATLRRYLKEIGRYPPLVHEREIELARRIHEGDEDALRELVESNLRFVVAYAKRYRNPNVPFLDLIHEGNLGLIQAAKKYDPTKEIPDPSDPTKKKTCDVKFITYAVWWVRQAIQSPAPTSDALVLSSAMAGSSTLAYSIRSRMITAGTNSMASRSRSRT